MDENKKNNIIFNPVSSKPDFPSIERDILDFWKSDRTFEEYEAQFEGAVSFLEQERLRRRLDEARSESKRAEEARDFTRHRELLTVVRDLTGQLQNLKSSG